MANWILPFEQRSSPLYQGIDKLQCINSNHERIQLFSSKKSSKNSPKSKLSVSTNLVYLPWDLCYIGHCISFVHISIAFSVVRRALKIRQMVNDLASLRANWAVSAISCIPVSHLLAKSPPIPWQMVKTTTTHFLSNNRR